MEKRVRRRVAQTLGPATQVATIIAKMRYGELMKMAEEAKGSHIFDAEDLARTLYYWSIKRKRRAKK